MALNAAVAAFVLAAERIRLPHPDLKPLRGPDKSAKSAAPARDALPRIPIVNHAEEGALGAPLGANRRGGTT